MLPLILLAIGLLTVLLGALLYISKGTASDATWTQRKPRSATAESTESTESTAESTAESAAGGAAGASSGLSEVVDPGLGDTDSCVTIGASCAILDVCCNGLECVGEMCRDCGALGAACAMAGCCAAGLECRDGACRVLCGAQGDPCAAGGCCAAGLECRDGACRVPCGAQGDPCTTGGCCAAGLECRDGACRVPCGALGNPCPAGGCCVAGLECRDGACRVPCGALGDPCPAGGCCVAGLECRDGACRVPCGALGDPCPAGGCCIAGLECRDGACRVPCGAQGDSCAQSGCCDAGLHCNFEAVCECNVGLGQSCGPAHGCCAHANATCETDAAGASTCCFARGQRCGVTSHCCGDDECGRNVCVPKCVPPAPGACHSGEPCCGGKTCVELTSRTTGEPLGLFGCGDACSAAECTSNADCCSSMTCEAGVCTPHCTPYGAVQHSADQGCCDSTTGGAIRTVNAPGGPVEMCISSNDATYAKTGCWPPPRRPPEVGGDCTGVVGEACRVGTCYSSGNLGGGCCNGLVCGADQTCKCTAREGTPCGPGGCCYQGLACSDGVCTCRAEGEACLELAGCCNDGLCANGVCVGSVGGTACAGAAQSCSVSAECCGGAAAFCGESNSLDPYVGRRCRAKRQGDEEPVYPGYAAQGIQHRDILPQETFCGNALGYGWDAGTMRNPAFAATCRSKYAQVRGYQGRRLERCEVREVNGALRCRSSAEVVEA